MPMIVTQAGLDAEVTLAELAKRENGFRGIDSGLEKGLLRFALIRMVADGRLFKASISHKNVRYYPTQEAAARALHQRTLVRLSTSAPLTKADWPEGSKTHYPTNADGTPAYKITIAKTPDRVLRTNTHGSAA